MSASIPLKRFVVFGRGKDHSTFGAENFLWDCDTAEAAHTYVRTWTQARHREAHVWDTKEMRILEDWSV